MYSDWQVIDLIERAVDGEPFCACGRPTTAMWRDGVVWLECTSLLGSPETRLGRLGRFLSAPVHTHLRIVDVPPAVPGPSVLAGE